MPKVGLDRSKTGRQKGTPNKTTALLKDAILKAAEAAGGEKTADGPGGIVAYLQVQALTNPGPFMALLGKVLPLQLTGQDGGPVQVSVVRFTADDKTPVIEQADAWAAGVNGAKRDADA